MKISIVALVLLTVSTTVAAWGDQGLGESDLNFAFLILNHAFLLTDSGKKYFKTQWTLNGNDHPRDPDLPRIYIAKDSYQWRDTFFKNL